MQKWEIAGISVYPVIEAVLAINVAMGTEAEPWMPEALLLRLVAAVATIAALVRAALDQRKASA